MLDKAEPIVNILAIGSVARQRAARNAKPLWPRGNGGLVPFFRWCAVRPYAIRIARGRPLYCPPQGMNQY